MSNLNVGKLTATNGVVFPQFTTANLPAGELGMTVFDTDEESLKFYNGTEWIAVGSGGTKTAAITVTNPTGNAATNIPVKVKITGTASGSTGDFGDVKFYSDSAATVPLSYWRETFQNGTYAEFWVKVPNIPGSGATFYAQTSSQNTYSGNINDVFLYYNAGDSITGWSTRHGTITTNGTVIIKTGSGGSAANETNQWYAPGESDTEWSDYIWEYDVRAESAVGYPWSSVRIRSPSGSSVTKWWFEGSNGSGNTWRPYTSGSDGGWLTQNTSNSGIGRTIATTWEKHYLIASNNVGKVLWSTNTFGTNDSGTTFGYGHWDYASQTTNPETFVQQQNYGSLPTNQGAYGTIGIDNHSGTAPNLRFRRMVVRKTFQLNSGDTSTSLTPTVTVGTFA